MGKAVLVLGFVAVFVARPVFANGSIGEHVNHLQDNIAGYTRDVNWLSEQVGAMVDAYAKGGKAAVNTDELAELWEQVDFHPALESHFIPVYAEVWQGIFGLKGAMDAGQPVAEVHRQQALLERALWQGLGAVRLAAQFQEKGLLKPIDTSLTAPTTPAATVDEVKHQLERVVAKYAEQLPDAAISIVQDTYLHLFEGIEGALIEQDAAIVEDLEKDFNVTLPLAIKNAASVDDVRGIVVAMQAKLDTCKALLEDAGKNRGDVF
ncbi:hypothetical protein [Haliea sp. E17]|uniref:hypothetical protein n=1 Tax=Haliea sp. E17 TaxID=3401576 RepID=UPI003AAAF188